MNIVPPANMKRPTQLPLAWPIVPVFSREQFIVSPSNADALAFIEKWPDWTAPVAALHGPPGCGKTHLASIWRAISGAEQLSAATLTMEAVRAECARVIEDVDSTDPAPERDTALFAAIENARLHVPLLLTGVAPPSLWPCTLPDLSSRFSAVIALQLKNPDEGVLAGLAQKLFADRQIPVSGDVIDHILRVLDRSPAALREFVAKADAAALAEARPVTVGLVRRLLADRPGGS